MTDAQIKQFLATIGAGATREVRESTANDDLIGMFGVGFLSAFVIGSHVTVETTPWGEPSTGWAYQSSGGRQYVLRPVPPRSPGTTVTIELTDEAETLSDPTVLDHLARRFCSLLRMDVYVGDQTEPINLVPPWRDEVANGVAEHPVSAARRRREFATAFEHLEDGERPLVGLEGSGVVPEVETHVAQVRERESDLRVVAAVGGFVDHQRPLVGLDGAGVVPELAT